MTEGSAAGITFGTLYEILKRNDYNVTGDSEAFSVMGLDGHNYDFSYAFYEYKNEFESHNYYYLKDNKKVVTNRPVITNTMLHDIFGITILPNVSAPDQHTN